MLIEQAIFTSARTEQADGYQLLARSPGITDQQACELTAWGPSHDALNPNRDEQSSVNFHKLSCGTFCVSKTVAAGQEYSSRGGARIYTQFLLVPPTVLARFGNNPFAILRAAWAKGVLTVHDQPPAILESFTLAGRSASVDEGLLGQLADQWGANRVAKLVAAAMSPVVQLLAGNLPWETVFGGLLQCFPVRCRTEVTFTTGLRFSPRRPFRLSPISDDAVEQRRAVRNEEVTFVDLSTAAKEDPTKEVIDGETISNPWAVYVAEAIQTDQLARLAATLQQPRPNLQFTELNQLGEQLLKQLRCEPVTVVVESTGPQSEQFSQAAIGSARLYRTDRPRNPHVPGKNPDPHQPCNLPLAPPNRAPGVSFIAGHGSKIHTVTDPAAIELLEQLDDTVYEAVHAVEGALDRATKLWAQLTTQLPAPTMTALREQYLQYALTLWDACHAVGIRDADKAIGALDIITALFKVE